MLSSDCDDCAFGEHICAVCDNDADHTCLCDGCRPLFGIVLDDVADGE